MRRFKECRCQYTLLLRYLGSTGDLQPIFACLRKSLNSSLPIGVNAATHASESANETPCVKSKENTRTRIHAEPLRRKRQLCANKRKDILVFVDNVRPVGDSQIENQQVELPQGQRSRSSALELVDSIG